MSNNNDNNTNVCCKVNFKAHDYRAFIFVLHEIYGLMLLQCSHKKKKPQHWQLPGGHVDDNEFIEAAKESDDYETQLITATKRGAARELYEETGIDVRYQSDRLRPATLRPPSEEGDTNAIQLQINEYKHRLFYFLFVTDEDFITTSSDSTTDGFHITAFGSSNLKLKLSGEHSGFTFQPEPIKAAEMLENHSGGKISEALRMSMASSSSSTEAPTCTIIEPPPQLHRLIEFNNGDVDNSMRQVPLEVNIIKKEGSKSIVKLAAPPPSQIINESEILAMITEHDDESQWEALGYDSDDVLFQETPPQQMLLTKSQQNQHQEDDKTPKKTNLKTIIMSTNKEISPSSMTATTSESISEPEELHYQDYLLSFWTSITSVLTPYHNSYNQQQGEETKNLFIYKDCEDDDDGNDGSDLFVLPRSTTPPPPNKKNKLFCNFPFFC